MMLQTWCVLSHRDGEYRLYRLLSRRNGVARIVPADAPTHEIAEWAISMPEARVLFSSDDKTRATRVVHNCIEVWKSYNARIAKLKTQREETLALMLTGVG